MEGERYGREVLYEGGVFRSGCGKGVCGMRRGDNALYEVSERKITLKRRINRMVVLRRR